MNLGCSTVLVPAFCRMWVVNSLHKITSPYAPSMRPSINAFMLNQNLFDTTASTYTYRAMLGDLVNHVVLPERLPEKQEMDIC